MLTVAADIINSKNKQKSTCQLQQIRQENSRKQRELKMYYRKNANSHSCCNKFKEQTKR